MRVNGVFVSIVVADVFVVAISLVLFRRGKWARQKI
jgi:Na+-driven multidrug efflux pump